MFDDNFIARIENESPQASDLVLSELEARAYCVLNGYVFKQMLNNKYPTLSPYRFSYYDRTKEIAYKLVTYPINYLRSRDALKAIRPGDWIMTIDVDHLTEEGVRSGCVMYQKERGERQFAGEGFFEEAAELSAVLQTLQWCRDNANKK